jgi:hypothetical protein
VANVGLLYVGAVLFLNGLMLLGWVNAKSVIPLNLFVGALQVITPTYLIFTSGGDATTILNASGLYLFGFTYLYVAMNQWMELDGTGLGYFSLFVALCALVYAWLNFTQLNDAAFGVIWLLWAFLWTLFFVVLGLGKVAFGRYTGAVCAIEGVITGAIPAFILLTGHWADAKTAVAVALAIFSVVAFGLLWPVLAKPALATTTQGKVGEPVS